MESLDHFREAIAKLESLHGELAALPKSGAEDWRDKLICYRRQLEVQKTAVAGLPVWRELGGNEEDRIRLKAALSGMRSALALHQASWPAVAIDPDDRGYQQSVGSVREANRIFLDLARTILLKTPSSPRT